MGTVIFCLDYDSLGNTRSLSKSVPQTDVIWYIIKKPKDIYLYLPKGRTMKKWTQL